MEASGSQKATQQPKDYVNAHNCHHSPQHDVYDLADYRDTNQISKQRNQELDDGNYCKNDD